MRCLIVCLEKTTNSESKPRVQTRDKPSQNETKRPVGATGYDGRATIEDKDAPQPKASDKTAQIVGGLGGRTSNFPIRLKRMDASAKFPGVDIDAIHYKLGQLPQARRRRK